MKVDQPNLARDLPTKCGSLCLAYLSDCRTFRTKAEQKGIMYGCLLSSHPGPQKQIRLCRDISITNQPQQLS